MGWKLTEAFVQIGAPLGKLSNDLKKAKAKFASAISSIKTNAKTAAKGFAIVGAAAAAAGVLILKSFANAGDEMDKMSLRTGFTAEALSELKFAAEISGSSIQDVELAMKRLAKNLLDAESGLKESQRSFEALGLSFEEINKLSPEEAFQAVADAVGAIESPMKRAAVAQELFGRSGTKLLPLFAEGADGMAKLREEANDLGIVFSQSSAKQAAILTDALLRLKSAFFGLIKVIAEAIAPSAIEGILSMKDSVVRLAEAAKPVAQNIKNWAVENRELLAKIVPVVGIIGALVLALTPLLIILPAIVASFKILAAAAVIASGPIGLVAIAIAGVAAFVVPWKKISDSFKALSTDTKSVSDNVSAIGDENKISALAIDIGKVATEAENAATGLGDTRTELGEVDKVAGSAAESIDAAFKSIGELKPIGKPAKLIIDSMGKIKASIVGEGGILETMRGTTKTTNTFFNAISNVATVTSEGLGQVGKAAGTLNITLEEAEKQGREHWEEQERLVVEYRKAYFEEMRKTSDEGKRIWNQQTEDAREATVEMAVSAKDFRVAWIEELKLLLEENKEIFKAMGDVVMGFLRVSFNIIARGGKAIENVFLALNDILNGIALKAVQLARDILSLVRGEGIGPQPIVPPGGFLPPGAGESARATSGAGMSIVVNVNGTAGEDPERFSERVVAATLNAVRRGKFNRAALVPGMA